jgi:hypothetical protein
LLALVSTLAFLVVAAPAASGAAAAPGAAASPSITFIGDSVPAGVLYVPSAKRYLERKLGMSLDLRVCRRLVADSCTYQGSTPSTAYERALSGPLAGTVVIDVGYNDYASRYASDLNRVMRVLRRRGVDTVVWVTLREVRDDYREMNAAIRAARKRWPQLRVADWNARSKGQAWFADDGLHLNHAGAWGLAGLLRDSLRG